MKTKIRAIFISLVFTANLIMSTNGLTSKAAFDYLRESYPYEIITDAYYSQTVDWDLWERFLKYDLCITDYDSLTEEEKELCRYIFETERSAKGTVRCERARLTLLGEAELGERYTLEQAYDSIKPYYNNLFETYPIFEYNDTFTYCQPDIKHIDGDISINEYWIDDEGIERILFTGEGDGFVNYRYFVYLKSGEEESIWYDNNVYKAPKEPEIIAFDESSFYLTTPEGKAWYCEWIQLSSTETNPKIEKDGIIYALQPDGTAAIIGNTFSSNEIIEDTITIPEEIEGYPIVAIDSNAFIRCSLVQVVLPDTITYIGTNAFYASEHLKQINFPDSLTYIGISAFEECSSLNTIEINCPELEINQYTFKGSGITEAKLTVKAINSNAFENCSLLKSFTLNEGLEKIEAYAFKGCSALTTAEFPTSLKRIGQSAFEGVCIETLTIPSTLEVIGTLKERHGKIIFSGFEPMPANDPLTEEDTLIVDSDCTINGYYNTEAHRYAVEWGLKFNPLDEGVAYGDINIDGEISVADAVLLQKYITGSGEAIGFEADLSKDGIIDIFDVIEMRSKLIEK